MKKTKYISFLLVIAIIIGMLMPIISTIDVYAASDSLLIDFETPTYSPDQILTGVDKWKMVLKDFSKTWESPLVRDKTYWESNGKNPISGEQSLEIDTRNMKVKSAYYSLEDFKNRIGEGFTFDFDLKCHQLSAPLDICLIRKGEETPVFIRLEPSAEAGVCKITSYSNNVYWDNGVRFNVGDDLNIQLEISFETQTFNYYLKNITKGTEQNVYNCAMAIPPTFPELNPDDLTDGTGGILFIARNTGAIWSAIDNIKIVDFAKIVYSKPGTGEIYHTLINDESFAGQSFKAIGKEITEASIWLMSDAEGSIILQILSGSINGTVIGEVSIHGGKAGKVTGCFDQPINVDVGEIYFLKVTSPTGAIIGIQRQGQNDEDVGYYEKGTSKFDMALELKYKLFDSVLSYSAIDELFNYVFSDYYAMSSFKALDNSIKGVSVWLYEGNDDQLSVDIISNSINGKVIATGVIPPGGAGKRDVVFTKQIYLEKDMTYYIKVSTGAPGTTTGSVAATTETEEIQGYTENGISDKDMAFEIIFTQWLGSLPDPFEESLELEPGYEESVNNALIQKIDAWGEELITRPEGPTYENIKDYLKPLMLAGTSLTDSGVYYIPFGRPMSASGGGPVALHVADGSQIISNKYNSRKMTVFVGVQGKERFGKALARLEEPALDEEYYPILKTEYKDSSGVKYMQESFADYIAETSSLVSFVKITANKNNTEVENVDIKFNFSDTGLTVQGNKLTKDGNTYLVFEEGANFNGEELTYTVDLSDGADKTVYVVRLNEPSACEDFVINTERYETEKVELKQYWDSKLNNGTVVSVPENIVMNAMKNLLIQNLYLGWKYSVGNAYEQFFQPEGNDAAKVLGWYGFTEEQKSIQNSLIGMSKGPGPATYENWEWGEKLSHAAQYYFLTKDDSFINANKNSLVSYMQDMKEQMAADPNNLLEKQRYSGDISDYDYNFHHQAVAWRGMRDLAEIFRILGDNDLFETYSAEADKLKTALLNAVGQSKTELGDGAIFIPTRLLKDLQPYDPITETRIGSYWNLVAPYGFVSGIIEYDSQLMDGIYNYMRNYGSWLLGLVRFNYYPVEIGSYKSGGLPGYKTPGVDNVYGLSHTQLMAERDDVDRLVLALYGKLAHGMTRGTFICAEGDTIGVYPGEYYRTFYLPPCSANNALFLQILRLMLIRESVDENGIPENLYLANATPRGWLEDGKEIKIENMPTFFGPVSYTLTSHLSENYVDASVTIPGRDPVNNMFLKVRVPKGYTIRNVTINGLPWNNYDAEKEVIDLTGNTGELNIKINYRTSEPVSDPEAVETDKEALTEELIKGNNPDIDNVTEDLNLVTSIPNGEGCTISWTSSNEEVIATDGKVTKPTEGDEIVTLTATITKGAASDTKEFNVTVKQKESDYILEIGAESTGGAGYTRTIAISGAKADELAGKYLVVQFTEGTGVNAKVSVIMMSALGQDATVSYQAAGTKVEVWLASSMPDLFGEDMGATIYAYGSTN